MTRLRVCLSLALALLFLAPSSASAQVYCGVVSVDGGYIVVGEDADYRGHAAYCNWEPYSGEVRWMDLPGCDTSTTLPLKVTTSSLYTAPSHVAPVMGESIMCRSTDDGDHKILPWHTDFDFGFYYTGYAGKSIVYGTPNTDVVYTSDDAAGTFNYEFGRVCGYDGDDDLNGDKSVSPSYEDEECLNGGNGYYDSCDGDGLDSDDWTQDTSYACEYIDSVRSEDEYDCGCGDEPPDLWSSICEEIEGGC